MPRGAAAPAVVVPAAKKHGSATGTIAANDAAAQELAERRKLARAAAAAAWAFESEVGSKAALKNECFKDRGLTYNMVEPLLKELKAGGKKKRVDAPRDHHCQVLTNDERIKLAEWILACAADQNPKDRTAVSAKVKDMLRARHASNKKRKWREDAAVAAAFARCEVACVCGMVPCPYAKWKRCPACGPNNGLCKARACVAARKPLLLGYNPGEGAQDGV